MAVRRMTLCSYTAVDYSIPATDGVLIHLFDIQYYDGRISIASWILLAGLKQIIDYNPNKQ